ncbi:SMP-30/gluconolactonase/LRE family protein [Nocardia goodfellowii]|uniref:Cu-Zn family superoxide dismutase n=1 Tax=Nocardia goodfellowii TaxID=882446 RepID=A0ABS4QC26_9NOCA|nr:superoxide dismutase [Nocardia goodfellowii]MBP2188664.1 Cu-Zn family superoxide dismutase [Nocardia goodfellowii]
MNLLRPLVTTTAVALLAACGTDTATPSTTPRISTAYDLPGDRAYPEGIAADARTGATYVGSYSTGAIYRAEPGATEAEVFLPAGTDGRGTANGLKVDQAGRLWVTDSTKGVSVYDTATRALLATFTVPGPGPRFVNDLAITPDGTAYLTDSVRAVVYRVTPDQVARGGNAELAPAFDLSATIAPRADGFSLNGIVADPTGTYLLVVDMPTGDLYRITTTPNSSTTIHKVALRGGDVRNGDGLDLTGTTLRVVHNRTNTLTRWTLSDDYATATRAAVFTDESLAIPTTMVYVGGKALIAASQFDKGGPMGPGTPGPFKVLAVDGI